MTLRFPRGCSRVVCWRELAVTRATDWRTWNTLAHGMAAHLQRPPCHAPWRFLLDVLQVVKRLGARCGCAGVMARGAAVDRCCFEPR